MIIGQLGGVVMFVAINTPEGREIAGSRVAIDALIPLIFMFPAVDREILLVVIEGGWIPGVRCVAILTSCREAGSGVLGVVCRVIIRQMAAYTGVRRIVVIAIVTLYTAGAGVRTIQNPIIVVNREGGRRPARRGGVAHRTICRDIKRNVVRVGTAIVIRGMTTCTRIGCIGVVPVVAGIAIIGNGYVRSCKWIYRIMVKRGWSPGRFRVTSSTIGRELRSCMIRIGRAIVV